KRPGLRPLLLRRARVVAKKKFPVLGDWPADHTAELVLPVEAALRGIEVPGVQRGIAQELECAAVQPIATRAGHDIDDPTAGVAVLRVEVVREDAEFGDGIEIRNDGSAAVHQFLHVAAIHYETVDVFALPADRLV